MALPGLAVSASGLPPDVDWDDLLQEAFTRVFVGARVKPDGIAMVPFIAGIIRSLRSAHLRRAFGSGGTDAVQIDDATEPGHDLELVDPAPGPERSLIARQELDAIRRLFADDPLALKIIKGLGEGMTAEHIRATGTMPGRRDQGSRARPRHERRHERLRCIRRPQVSGEGPFLRLFWSRCRSAIPRDCQGETTRARRKASATARQAEG